MENDPYQNELPVVLKLKKDKDAHFYGGKCPKVSCGQELEFDRKPVEEERFGKIITCFSCGHTMTVIAPCYAIENT